MKFGYCFVTLLGTASLLSCLTACTPSTKAIIESGRTDGFSGTPQRIFVTAAMPTVIAEREGQDSASFFRTAMHEQLQQCGIDSSVLLNTSQTYLNTDLKADKPELRISPDPHTVASPDYNLQLNEVSKSQSGSGFGSGTVETIEYTADLYDDKTKVRVWRAHLYLLPQDDNKIGKVLAAGLVAEMNKEGILGTCVVANGWTVLRTAGRLTTGTSQ